MKPVAAIALTPKTIVVLDDLAKLGIHNHSFTLEAWVWFDAPGFVFGCIGGNAGPKPRFMLHCGLRPDMRTHMGFFACDSQGAGPNPLRCWMHVAYRYDAQAHQQAIFVNGIADGSPQKRPSFIAAGMLTLGGVMFPFSGRVADVRVWNVARSEDEIRTNRWRRLTGSEPGLTGYWRLDDGLKAAKVIGPAPVVVETPIPLAEVGEVSTGIAAHFDGKESTRKSRIEVPGWLDQTLQAQQAAKGLTIEAWLRAQQGLPQQWSHIVACYRHPEETGFALQWHATSPALVSVTNGRYSETRAPDPVGRQGWFHVAISHDQKDIRIYYNGVLVHTQAQVGKVDWGGMNKLTIGTSPSFPDSRFHGDVADLRIWNRPRDQAEIRRDYMRRVDPGKRPWLVAYYPLDFPPKNPDNPSQVLQGLGRTNLAGLATDVEWIDAALPPALWSTSTAAGHYRDLAAVALQSSQLHKQDAALKTTKVTDLDMQVGALKGQITTLEEAAATTASALRAEKAEVDRQLYEVTKQLNQLQEEEPPEVTRISDLYIKAADQIREAREQMAREDRGYRLGPVSIELKYFATNKGAVFPAVPTPGDDDAGGTGKRLFPDNVEMTVHHMEFLPPPPPPPPPQRKMVPDLKGHTVQMATQLAAEAGFTVEVHSQLIKIPSQDRELAGRVLSQVPKPGATLESTVPTVIRIFVGKPGAATTGRS